MVMDSIVRSLLAGEKNIRVAGLRGPSSACLAARLARKTGRSLLYVVAGEEQAEKMAMDLTFFADREVLFYPGYDIAPYTPLSPEPETIAARLSVLYRLLESNASFIMVTSVEALCRRVMPRKKLAGLAELVIRNEETDQKQLVQLLSAAGYEPVSLVRAMGDFCVRGGIVDVFPPNYENPLRLDFFGDTVESIRLFDPISQRSIGELEEVIFLPASNILFPEHGSDQAGELLEAVNSAAEQYHWAESESERLIDYLESQRRFPGIEFYLPLFYQSPAALFDYLHKNTLVMLADRAELNSSAELAWERIEANYAEAAQAGVAALPPDRLFQDMDEVELQLHNFTCVQLQDFQQEDEQVFVVPVGNHTLIRQEIDLQRKKEGLLAPLAGYISSWQDRGDQVIMACRSQRHCNHIAELIRQHGIDCEIVSGAVSYASGMPRKTLMLSEHPLTEGFDLDGLLPDGCSLHFLSESELFGEKRLGIRKKGKHGVQKDVPPLNFEELQTGDVVVHADHGLGIYEGLVNIDLLGVLNDFMQVAYQGSDKLYVPVDRIGKVSKYQGLSDRKPKLDRLGSKNWLAAKKKVKEAVWKVAQDLLELYAKRELQQGRAFSPAAELFNELEESFPFDETAGQKKAIAEVLEDLEAERPMDRLICGDVGYGKTEVAVRAAFKVIEDGFQVVMLVPTTVLAEQHAKTFRERFRGFPVQVECLSRFRTQKEQKDIVKALGRGEVDIVIGTHRLLSKDVLPRRLGLLIIDEEHRFGVSHKEKIKRFRTEVDVLTLTATPIPRTLQMSLLSIRDLSIISTPPLDRRSVKTFVCRYDDLVIKEAVSREMRRNGQVFLVHNRVRSIHETARRVQELIPEARVAVAHGRMAAKSLEEIMVRFVRKELDVLVCTTIIESGLDIPSANTIIINRADRLGLAEIYQLRGRVGRSSEQSYAYLMVPSLKLLSRDAKNRLRALMDYSELGGGFKLAMSDLQIRGGGNILGVSQSGNIAAVGYDLYLDLLQKTVADLKSGRLSDSDSLNNEMTEPEINLHVSAFIPDSYIVNTEQRYVAYRKIGAIATEQQLLDMRAELKDRYGRIPAEAENLLEVMDIKVRCRELRISKLEQGRDSLIFTFLEGSPVQPKKIMALMGSSDNQIRLTPDSRLIVKAAAQQLQSDGWIFTTVSAVLQGLRP